MDQRHFPVVGLEWRTGNAGGAVIDRPGTPIGTRQPRFRRSFPLSRVTSTIHPALPAAEPPALPRDRLRPASVAAELAAIAELRAAEAGVGADRVLITWGLISEETYVAALAASLGMEFEPLFNTPREHCPLSDEQLIEAANTGMLPLSDRNGVKFVVVPRLVDSRRLVAVAMSGGELARPHSCHQRRAAA